MKRPQPIILKSTTAKVIELRDAIKRARANYNRQRRKEEMRMDVRVRSSFWDQVERDYQRQLKPLVEKLKEMGVAS